MVVNLKKFGSGQQLSLAIFRRYPQCVCLGEIWTASINMFQWNPRRSEQIVVSLIFFWMFWILEQYLNETYWELQWSYLGYQMPSAFFGRQRPNLPLTRAPNNEVCRCNLVYVTVVGPHGERSLTWMENKDAGIYRIISNIQTCMSYSKHVESTGWLKGIINDIACITVDKMLCTVVHNIFNTDRYCYSGNEDLFSLFVCVFVAVPYKV